MFLARPALAALLALFLLPALSAQKPFPVAAVRADLDFLQKALYEGHQGVFRFTPKDSFDLFFNQLRARLPADTVSFDQTQTIFRLAIARVCDGHTSLTTPFYKDTTHVLPLTVHVEGARVFLLTNFSGDSTLKPGVEILQVNGLRVADIVRPGYLITTADGTHNSHRAILASVYFARYLRLFYGPAERFTVLVKDPATGALKEHRLQARSRAELLKTQIARSNESARKRRPVKPVFRDREQALYRDTLQKDMAILKMTEFETQGYRRFYRRMFRWMQREGIQNLVIDLRFNTGGNILNMGCLIGRILDASSAYDYTRRKGVHLGPYFGLKGKMTLASLWLRYRVLPGLRRHREGEIRVSTRRIKVHRRHNFDGKVYLLTDGFSFSSASMCASFLKNKGKNVTVIGTETGGNEAGNCGGGFPQMRLPNTRFKVRYPLYYLRYQVGKNNEGQGVKPDYPTPRHIDDLLQQRDLEMEKVRELTRG